MTIMVEMHFHWCREEDEKEGLLKVLAATIDDCLEVAGEELEDAGLTITDYYQIEGDE